MLGTGVLLATQSNMPLFAQTVVGNLTPLMFMAALAWIARTYRKARNNYTNLHDAVADLKVDMDEIKAALKLSNKRNKRR